MKVYACTEGRSGQVDAVSLEMIAAARQMVEPGDEVIAFFAGSSKEDACAKLGSADRLIAAVAPGAEIVAADVYARQLCATIAAEGAGAVVVPYSANGLDVASAVAVRTGWPLISYVDQIERNGDTLSVVARMYAGKVLAECEAPLPAVLMVNPGAFKEADIAPIPPERVQVADASSAVATSGARPIAIDLPDFSDVDLKAAERIVCVGRGIGDEASIDLARGLADLLGAEIAGSRPVVDSGWLPKLRQVGKSGQKVKPRLYIALGVSGAPEHVEGMGQADTIIAVNTDPKAPIFSVAHYGSTCDLFDLISSLSERLQTTSR
ncbi:electron transfer flavoprotein subunit alpha/FixB family protein [Mesorhizobium sp. VNQ89]|uniref:electron transfer flavoprotein subunit alpha/FixB family protein n=1 Tax=Mesorhizobium quangtriensis TaxID=3157709 RepID=UPI0032B727E7